eukprot:6980-Lingulodinium_polyedra.AAC.1
MDVASQTEAQTRKHQLETSAFVIQILPDPGDPLLVARARGFNTPVCDASAAGRSKIFRRKR